MDGFTHIVAGAAVAATWHRSQKQTTQGPSFGAVFLSAALGSLAPDLDVCDDPYRQGGLGYLLNHRGLTHSVLGCVILAVGIAGLVYAWPRHYRQKPNFALLFGSAFLGSFLHLVFDATNDYGVHPFSPIWNGWIYGDFLFLAEPLISMALLPLALHPWMRDHGSRFWNLVLAALALTAPIGAAAFLWLRVNQQLWMTAWPAALATVWIVGQFAAYLTWKSRAASWCSVILVAVTFWIGSVHAKGEARALLEREVPQERLAQLVATPAPSNPFCWRIVSTSRHLAEDTVIVRIGTLSVWPELISPAECYTPNREPPPTARLNGHKLPSDERWYWVGTFEGPASTFEELARDNCRVAAMKEFLRAPFWVEAPDSVTVGDLRFDYSIDLSKYCKYRFVRNEPVECKPRLVSPLPPFFTGVVAP